MLVDWNTLIWVSIASMIFCGMIASGKGYDTTTAILVGLVFGLFGVMGYVLAPSRKAAPVSAVAVTVETRCPQCGQSLQPGMAGIPNAGGVLMHPGCAEAIRSSQPEFFSQSMDWTKAIAVVVLLGLGLFVIGGFGCLGNS